MTTTPAGGDRQETVWYSAICDVCEPCGPLLLPGSPSRAVPRDPAAAAVVDRLADRLMGVVAGLLERRTG